MTKLKICWRDPRDPPAFFEIFGIEVTILISTFAKMASNILGRYCATKAWFFTTNFESSVILGSFFFTVSVKLLLKDYLEDLGVICLFLHILYLGWYY
jgi:hypothetical protein